LFTNFLPVRFSGQVVAGALPYESAAHLGELRSRLRESHVVVRDRNDVVCVPLAQGAEQIGERRVIVSTTGDVLLHARLLEECLRRILTTEWEYLLRREYPVRFMSRLAGKDLVEQALGRGIDRLHVYPEYSLDVRRSGPREYPGVVIGRKARYEIDLPVDVLLRRGVPVVGLYVLAELESTRAWPFQDAHARRKLVGRVTDVVDGMLHVQSREGEVKLDAARTWIESNLANFQTVLRKACGRSFERGLVALDGKIAAFNNAERRIADTDRIASALLDRGPLDVAAGMTAHLAKPLRLKGNQHPHVRTLSEPTFVFDQSGDKTDRYPEGGLNRFGPFDTESFTPKAPTIAVVVPRQFQGRVETFLTRFRDGVRGSSVFPEGFVRKFRLTDCTFTITVFDGDVQDASAYKRACLSVLEAKEKIDLAFVFTSAAQEHLTGNESPYLVSKSTFMSQSIAVQEFQVENITDSPSIAYPLSTMALAVYAKLGGTPFAIKDNGQPTRRELIFGIGSAQVFEDRLGKGERVVGITTVFNADGTYLVSNVSREAPYEQYPKALQEALRACLTEVKGRQGWKPNDFIRLVFHVFKLLKDEKAQAIKELVEGLTSDFAGVEFAFVTVVDDHPWMILDENEKGVSVGKGSKGKYVAGRGFAVPISRSEMLVTVKGPREMKSESQGAPKPLQLKLHRESTFTDIDYLAGQLFRFTAMSWRRPYPSAKPVTILYSDLIAGLLGKLRHVTNWNSDVIFGKLRYSRWFL
jgi:hypothetical protein